MHFCFSVSSPQIQEDGIGTNGKCKETFAACECAAGDLSFSVFSCFRQFSTPSPSPLRVLSAPRSSVLSDIDLSSGGIESRLVSLPFLLLIHPPLPFICLIYRM